MPIQVGMRVVREHHSSPNWQRAHHPPLTPYSGPSPPTSEALMATAGIWAARLRALPGRCRPRSWWPPSSKRLTELFDAYSQASSTGTDYRDGPGEALPARTHRYAQIENA